MAELATLHREQDLPFRWPGTRQDVTQEQRLAELAGRLCTTLALARALIRCGRTVDLTGVDDGVGILCAQTLDLPLAEARRLRPALNDLLGQLDHLSMTIHRAVPHTGRAC